MRLRAPHGDTSSGHQRSPNLLLPELALAFLAVGAFVRFWSGPSNADVVWMIGLVATGVPVVWRTLRRFASGHFATDLVAALAVATSVILLHPLAGLVIVLMQTGGEALERYAEGRASAAVRALEEEAPRIAHRFPIGEAPVVGAATDEIGVAAIAVGDHLLVRPGEMVPCDAVVVGGSSHVDTSRLTGEPIPVRAGIGAGALERHPQPRRRARRTRHGYRGRQPVRAHRRAGAFGTEHEGAAATAGGQVRGVVHTNHAARVRCDLPRER